MGAGSQALTAPVPLATPKPQLSFSPESDDLVSPSEASESGFRLSELPFAVQLLLAVVLPVTGVLCLRSHSTDKK